MVKILKNIEDTWWETSNISLRDSCRSHCRPMFLWRYDVSTHNMKGINCSVKNIRKIFSRC